MFAGTSVFCEDDARDVIFKEGLVRVSEIQVTDERHVHIAMIITNVKNNDTSQLSAKISQNLSRMMMSILKFSILSECPGQPKT